jgi:hypothetical protein
MDPTIYQQNGFTDREHYIQSLRDEYGAELVDSIGSCLPPSEDFDGLVSALEDAWEEMEGGE